MKPVKPIRLFWGENYAAKPDIVQKAISRAVKNSINSIHLYPGKLYQEVVNLISTTLHVASDQIVLGHGIEGLIHTTSEAFLDKGKTGGMFFPSFFVYENNLNRAKSLLYQCRYDTKIDVDDFIRKIQQTNVFFLASPNTATGNYLLTTKEIEKVLKNYQGLFTVDECYLGIGNQTVLPLLNRYDNLLIYRGITKVMGMASLRLGFAIGNKKIVDKLKYHITDIELDPINTFSLNIFKETFPHFDILAQNTKAFFHEFLTYMKEQFPKDSFMQTYTTFYFMNITRYKSSREQILNYMTDHGYEFSSTVLHECPKGKYPELIELSPPPKQYWDDFVKTLKKAFLQY